MLSSVIQETEQELQRSVGSARCRRPLPEPEQQHSVVCKCGRPLRAAMPVDEAQRSRVAPLPVLLDAADIERIHECAALAQRRCGRLDDPEPRHLVRRHHPAQGQDQRGPQAAHARHQIGPPGDNNDQYHATTAGPTSIHSNAPRARNGTNAIAEA